MSVTTHKFITYAYSAEFKLGDIANFLHTDSKPKTSRNCVSRYTSDSGVFAFSFGALAYWNTSADDISTELHDFANEFGEEAQSALLTEDFLVEEDPHATPKVGFNKLVVDKLTPERAQLIAQTVAQSAAMEYYETLMDRSMVEVDRYLRGMRKNGRLAPLSGKLNKFIAKIVTMRNKLINVLHLLDRPDQTWTDRTMDALYADLRHTFDLEDRYQALVHKQNAIQDTLEILLDTARDGRLFIIETGILLLVGFEVVMYALGKM